ncbi:flagellar basal body-associated FliL family protein [Clostridium sp. DL1XJH146]
MEEKNIKKKSKKKLIIILLVVLLLACIGGTFAFFKVTGRELPFFTEEEQVESVVSLQQFIVNLKTSDSKNSYLKVTVVLGYMEENANLTIDENTEKIRDRIIEILRTKSTTEFEEDDATLVLKADIKNSINELLGEPLITSIYFNDFMIQ